MTLRREKADQHLSSPVPVEAPGLKDALSE